MTDRSDLTAVTAEMALMRARMAELETEVARLQEAPPPTATSEPPPPAEPADEPLGRRAALRKAGLMAAGAVAGGAALAATTASPAAATTTGTGNPGVLAIGLGGDGVSANTNTSGRSGVYATTGTTGAWGVFAAHSGGGQALQASASPTLASGKPVAAVTNDGTGLALKATGNPAVAAYATSTGQALLATATGSAVAVSVTGGGIEALATATGTTGLRSEDHDVGVATDLCGQVNLRLGATILGAPPARTVAALRGDVVNDGTDLWCCVTSGTPGVWRKVGGPQTAGALHVLPVPVRVYDTFATGAPTTVGPKTQMVAGVPRTLDLTVNSSGVPVGATAAIVTLYLLVGGTSGSAAVCAAGVTIPTGLKSLSYGTFTDAGQVLTPLDASARIQVQTSTSAEMQVDVVGYYR